MPISKKLRFEVFKRDQFQCLYCGRNPPVVVLEVDHIHPVSLGGTDDEFNLVTACFDCNRGKGARALTSMPDATHRTEKRQEALDQLEAYNAIVMAEREQLEEAHNRVLNHWFIEGGKSSDFFIEDGFMRSVRMFLRRLPEDEVIDAIDIAYSRRPLSSNHEYVTFKYFCGVCWNKIRDEK